MQFLYIYMYIYSYIVPRRVESLCNVRHRLQSAIQQLFSNSIGRKLSAASIEFDSAERKNQPIAIYCHLSSLFAFQLCSMQSIEFNAGWFFFFYFCFCSFLQMCGCELCITSFDSIFTQYLRDSIYSRFSIWIAPILTMEIKRMPHAQILAKTKSKCGNNVSLKSETKY